MAKTETTDYPRGLTFEKVWAALMEDRKQMREDREQMKEDREKMREEMRENAEKINKQIGSLTNLFGDFTLGMVAPKLREKFADLGLVFPKSYLNAVLEDRPNRISFETDILLENGDTAMLVEVKTKLTKERLYSHIERLEKMRRYADLHGDKRTFLGAVAGFAIIAEIREMALKEGFYVIEPDGENFVITPPSDKPKEW